MNFPTSIAEITPEWLTDALKSTDAIRDSTVTSLETTILGEGAGFIGQLARLTLEYDQPEAGSPNALVAKLPAKAPENRELGDLFRLYERECRFYEDLATRVELRTPRCYYIGMDTQRGDFLLLLEDLAPAQVGDQLKGCSSADVELALRDLGTFHAGWWQSLHLDELEWMPTLNDPLIVGTLMQAYQDIWDQFLDRFQAGLTSSMLRTAERFGKHFDKITARLAEPPCTITHGDYRLDNMFFGSDGSEPVLTMIDWQVAARGRGVFDVTYFLTSALEPNERRSKEVDLLKRYHRGLVQAGVGDYSYEQCFLDYRLSALYCLAYAVIAAGSVDLVNDRAVALTNAIVERDFAAVEDLDAADLLPA